MAHLPPLPTSPRPRLLVVEDSAFVVMALETVCETLGWDMVGPAGTVAQGLALAHSGQQDGALLDVSLGGERSWPIAAVLMARGTPFAFVTGHDLAGVLPPEFTGVPVYRKPFRLHELEQALQHMLVPHNLAKGLEP